MNKTYIYIGIALAVLVVLLFVFKVEFSMITGTTNPDSRILSVTANGDLVLSDNTVQNINDYISNAISGNMAGIEAVQKEIETLQTQLKDEIAERKGDTSTFNKLISNMGNEMTQNYVRYNDEMQIAGTYGCQIGGYKNISTFNEHVAGAAVANYAPLGPNDPNPRFIIRKRCGGCDATKGASNKGLFFNYNDGSLCKGFIQYNANGSVKK